MRRLNDSEVLKLSEITGVPLAYIQQLISMRLFNDRQAMRLLVKEDFDLLKNQDRYSTRLIYLRLADKYQLSVHDIKNITYLKDHNRYFCENCDKVLSKHEYSKNDGLCDKCMAATIQI